MWASARDQPFFFGILIRMYFDDHNPPNIHAIYAGNEAQIAIEPIGIIEGKLPALHQRELRINWHRLLHEQPAGRIRPLEQEVLCFHA